MLGKQVPLLGKEGGEKKQVSFLLVSRLLCMLSNIDSNFYFRFKLSIHRDILVWLAVYLKAKSKKPASYISFELQKFKRTQEQNLTIL